MPSISPTQPSTWVRATAFHLLTAKVHWLLLDHDVERHDQPAGDGADN